MYSSSFRKVKRRTGYSKKSAFDVILNRILITGVLTIVCLIFLKRNASFKSFFYNNVLSINFNFASINSLYSKYFGGSLPFSDIFSETKTVFNEHLNYDGSSDYLDGVSLNVGSDYLVPSLDTGLVVFIGDKEGYGNTIIVQQVNGVDVWYSNLSDVSVNMYEYVSKGSFIGNCDNNLILVFKKDGNVLDYRKYV